MRTCLTVQSVVWFLEGVRPSHAIKMLHPKPGLQELHFALPWMPPIYAAAAHALCCDLLAEC